MRRTWFISAAIAVVGVLAGVGIAGRPTAGDTFIIDAAVTRSTDDTVAETSPPATAEAVSTSSTPAPPPDSTTTVAPTTVAPTAAETTSTAVPETTTIPPPPTTVAVETTAAPPENQTLDRADVRLVVANGDGRFNLAGANGNRLEKAGYVTIDLADVAASSDPTVLYYRPGFDDEAAIVAADLLVPGARLEPLPDTPITINDEFGDIVVVLGTDAVR